MRSIQHYHITTPAMHARSYRHTGTCKFTPQHSGVKLNETGKLFNKHILRSRGIIKKIRNKEEKDASSYADVFALPV